jgi:hypothetical protein
MLALDDLWGCRGPKSGLAVMIEPFSRGPAQAKERYECQRWRYGCRDRKETRRQEMGDVVSEDVEDGSRVVEWVVSDVSRS